MECGSVESRSASGSLEPLKSGDTQRVAAAREAGRAVQVREESQRWESVKIDQARGNTIGAFVSFRVGCLRIPSSRLVALDRRLA